MPQQIQTLIPDPQSLLTTAGNAVLSVLFAPVCAACDAVLDTPLSGCVCRNCWEQIHPVGSLIFEPGSPADRLVAVGAYDGVYRDIIHALKYQGRRSIAADLAMLMRRSGEELLAGAECVVPVPLHWRREYNRGFNQAREIARHLRRPVLDTLVRLQATRPQVELSREQRYENVKNVFALRRRGWRRRQELTGLNVVVVDDVATTGATFNACAAVLRRAGAAAVSGLTAARKV
jgi:ComF family protein